MNLFFGYLTDIDSLKYKRIKLVGELLNEQIDISATQIKLNLIDKLRLLNNKILQSKNINFLELQSFINYKFISLPFKRFFNSSELSQMLENTNNLTEITHKRKVISTISKQKNNKTSCLEIRELHKSHYGKICPIETVEGKNAGLIWSLAKEIKFNKYGFLETPYFV